MSSVRNDLRSRICGALYKYLGEAVWRLPLGTISCSSRACWLSQNDDYDGDDDDVCFYDVVKLRRGVHQRHFTLSVEASRSMAPRPPPFLSGSSFHSLASMSCFPNTKALAWIDFECELPFGKARFMGKNLAIRPRVCSHVGQQGVGHEAVPHVCEALHSMIQSPLSGERSSFGLLPFFLGRSPLASLSWGCILLSS